MKNDKLNGVSTRIHATVTQNNSGEDILKLSVDFEEVWEVKTWADWNKFQSEMTTRGLDKDSAYYICGSSIDFVDEETSDETLIDIVEKVFY
jgi:Fe-S cluster assembly iron-binding protein IscA